MSSLPAPLRRQLERTICDARKIAEVGAAKALRALAVHEPDPYRHMDDAQRRLRRRLRAQARQLGDGESRIQPGAYEIRHLVEKLAYDQWHRILFASYRWRTTSSCLQSMESPFRWRIARNSPTRSASRVPGLWPHASPPRNSRRFFAMTTRPAPSNCPSRIATRSSNFVTGLPRDVFTADDSLSWCYQFWQAERKDEVNAVGNKIGADEISPVTQLFTEDYMVDFRLDNTLGAWWAGKKAKDEGRRMNYETEAEARAAVALLGCESKYLRLRFNCLRSIAFPLRGSWGHA